MVSDPTCPCCNSEMEMHGDAHGGHLHYCAYCYGMLTTDRWLDTNMNAQVLRRMKATVFNGEDAGYSCPTCLGGMVKAPVSTTQSEPIEVDGCLKCGSLWFDNREIQPFVPDIQHLAPIPEDDPIGKAISSVLQWEKAIIRAITSLSGRNTDDSEE